MRNRRFAAMRNRRFVAFQVHISSMRNQRLVAIQNKGGSRGSNYNDFISRMPDELLLMILSLLPIKYAVVTSSLSTRWMFLWCGLKLLNFDGSETLRKINTWVSDSERCKYINQVNSVIRSYNCPMVQEFRIRFKLDRHYTLVINEWLRFAVNNKVEILEVDFMEKSHHTRDHRCNYVFPSRLSDRNIAHLLKVLSSSTTVVELVFLKKLILKNVNVKEEVLQEFLANSPHLETIIIHGSGLLKHIRKDFKPDSLPELPNVKKLTLTVGAHKDDNLLEFASLINACPNLETFTIEVLWYSPFNLASPISWLLWSNQRL